MVPLFRKKQPQAITAKQKKPQNKGFFANPILKLKVFCKTFFKKVFGGVGGEASDGFTFF